MKLILIITLLLINIFSFNIFAQTIAIVNVQSLIDNNEIYKKTLNDIEINQEKYLKDFNIIENELIIKLNKIEESKFLKNSISSNKFNIIPKQ